MEIQNFKNVHQGERVFILGNGPSLEQTPLERLDDEFTIAVNKISKIYSETDWRPSYFVFHDAVHEDWNQYGIDGLVENLSQDRIDSVQETVELGIPCFLSRPAERWFGGRENVLFYDPATPNTDEQNKVIKNKQIRSVWSNDIAEYITCFASSITVSAQIASYMGFTKLYFLGCDLYGPTLKQRLIYPEAEYHGSFDLKSNYKPTQLIEIIQKSDHKIKTLANTIYMKYLEDSYKKVQEYYDLPFDNQFNNKTHFTGYDSDTKRSAHSLNEQVRRAHKLIKLASEEYDFEAYNATVGGHLEVYERVDLNEIL
jgi:hypothetical protein